MRAGFRQAHSAGGMALIAQALIKVMPFSIRLGAKAFTLPAASNTHLNFGDLARSRA